MRDNIPNINSKYDFVDFDGFRLKVGESNPKSYIEKEVGEFLMTLVFATGSKSILEIGTGVGFSTLWLASGVKHNLGHVISIEKNPEFIPIALENIKENGLDKYVRIVGGHIVDLINSGYFSNYRFDFIFVDAKKKLYLETFDYLFSILKPKGLFVADDVLIYKDEDVREGVRLDMLNFIKYVEHSGVNYTVVTIGDGVMVVKK